MRLRRRRPFACLGPWDGREDEDGVDGDVGGSEADRQSQKLFQQRRYAYLRQRQQRPWQANVGGGSQSPASGLVLTQWTERAGGSQPRQGVVGVWNGRRKFYRAGGMARRGVLALVILRRSGRALAWCRLLVRCQASTQVAPAPMQLCACPVQSSPAQPQPDSHLFSRRTRSPSQSQGPFTSR